MLARLFLIVFAMIETFANRGLVCTVVQREGRENEPPRDQTPNDSDTRREDAALKGEGVMAKNKKPKFSVSGSSSKAQALEMMIGQIEKQFGPGSIMKIGEEHNAVEKDAVISTQSISLDVALGVGGFPKGRIIEIYGPESSGKTTLTLHAIASAQKMGGR